MPLRLLTLALAALALFSCRDEFVIEGEFQDIPVAYGYLNPDDDRHFVRVERAFLEAGGNANENAGNPDLIYYGPEEATVILENLTTGESQTMDRVDARDFGRSRADGIFADDPNLGYTASESELPLRGGDEVRLLIERPGEPTATATTTLLEDLEIIRPADLVRIAQDNRPLIMTWTKGPAAAVYDVRIFFNIRELFPADASMNRDRRLEWRLQNAYVPGDGDDSGSTVRLAVDPSGFYRFLGGALEEDPNVVRRFQSFDVQVAAAGQEVLDLRRLESANTGITGSGSLPRYTNLEGGIGLFTSNIVTLKEGVGFDGESLDSLRDGQFTRELGFR